MGEWVVFGHYNRIQCFNASVLIGHPFSRLFWKAYVGRTRIFSYTSQALLRYHHTLKVSLQQLQFFQNTHLSLTLHPNADLGMPTFLLTEDTPLPVTATLQMTSLNCGIIQTCMFESKSDSWEEEDHLLKVTCQWKNQNGNGFMFLWLWAISKMHHLLAGQLPQVTFFLSHFLSFQN